MGSITSSKIYLIISVAVLTAMLYMRDFGIMNFSSVAVTLVSVGMALLMPYENYMAYLFFIFPIIPGLPGSYMMPLFCVLWILKRRGKVRPEYLVFFLVFAMMELMHFFSYSFDKNILMIVRYLSVFFLFVMSFEDRTSSQEHYKRALLYAIGSIVLIIGVLINTSIMTGSIFQFGGRVGNLSDIDETLEGVIRLSVNPNGLAFASICAIVICLSLLSMSIYKSRILLYSAVIIALFAGFVSLSRTWVLVFALAVVLYAFSSTTNKWYKVLVLAIMAVTTLYLLSTASYYVDAIIGRFGDDTVSTGGSRTELFSKYNSFMFENPSRTLFGVGNVYYNNVAQLSNSTHNAIQQVFVAYGLIGIVIFAFAVIRLWLNNKSKFNVWYPVIVVFVFMQSIQFLNPFYLVYPILAAFQIVRGVQAEKQYEAENNFLG